MKIRPFLKWPGGKYRLVPRIQKLLPKCETLIEPFVGAGAVFLNTNYKKYILNDINQDLINLYTILQQQGGDFISNCKDYFKSYYNNEKQYYILRVQFNKTKDKLEKALLFLYLNRHGYNGLIRYNSNKKEFNVPFGSYKKPYFPEQEMLAFHEKSQNAKFYCKDYTKVLNKKIDNSVIYCDPPYVPLSKTSNFTAYGPDGFSLRDQSRLARIAEKLAMLGVPVLISNHSTEFTKELYAKAKVQEFNASRTISCKGCGRGQSKELLACFFKCFNEF